MLNPNYLTSSCTDRLYISGIEYKQLFKYPHADFVYS